MIRGYPAYTAFGRASERNYTIKPELRRRGTNEWITPDDLGADRNLVWSENRWDFTGQTDIEEIRFEIEVKFDLDTYRSGYSIDKVLDRIQFGVRVWNKASRTRRWFEGKISKNTNGKLVGKYSSHPIHAAQIGRLDNFAGEIEIEPLFLNTHAGLHDRNSGLKLSRGTVLGWADPLLIVLERSRTGISTMFDFRWVKFSENKDLGLGSDEFFKVVWDQKPVLYLNLETEHLQTVLMSNAPSGKVARTRDALNSLIAHQVLSVGVAASLSNALDLRESDDDDPDAVLSRMKPQEALLLRAWADVIDPVGGPKRRIEDVLSDLFDEPTSRIAMFMVEELPSRLQQALGSEKKAEELLKVAAAGGDADA